MDQISLDDRDNARGITELRTDGRTGRNYAICPGHFMARNKNETTCIYIDNVMRWNAYEQSIQRSVKLYMQFKCVLHD